MTANAIDDLPSSEGSNPRPQAINWLVRVLREPLFHFLILGALLFGLYGWVNGSALNSTSPREIEISAKTIQLLKNDWWRQWLQDPTPEDLQREIDRYIHDEIFYREALALDMNQNDLIIRRRLIQKMEFLAEDVASLQEPTNADLQGYLETHADRYAVPARFSFSQVYFSSELRGDQAQGDALKLLTKLEENPDGGNTVEKMGDRSMLPRTFTVASTTTLNNLFGSTFAAEMATVTKKGWHGPFHSSYGNHLVNVSSLMPGHPATLAEVRRQVRLDWLENQRQESNQQFYQQLRDRYTVKILPEAIVQPTTEPESNSEAG